MDRNISKTIDNYQREFDNYLKKLLISNLPKSYLSEVILYGSLNGGKRIRPFLISVFSKIAKVPKINHYRLAAAVECIHSYSLIHDDLPSMDDDNFRRGKPSAHKKFNEAQAILAGDSLHDIAFEILSDKKTHSNALVRANLVNSLSSTLGTKGLAGGQSLDLIYENKNTDKSQILKMYKMKTAALFSFCCKAPFIMARKTKKELNFAIEYGKIFGLVFQIVDDYLDEFGNFKKLGKTPGKDKKQGKSTLLKYMKKNDIIPYCKQTTNQFIKKNINYISRWRILEYLLISIIQRNY